MTEYVLAYAHRIGVKPPKVLLVKKEKPDWQRGRLNLPGGHIEAGESPEEAAVRELFEETGIVASLPDTKVLGIMSADDWRVYVCWCPYRTTHGSKIQAATTKTKEEVREVWLMDVLREPRLIPNLKLIIPLCHARLSGWSMTPTREEHIWSVNV